MRIASKVALFSSVLLAAGCTSPEKRASTGSQAGAGGQVISSPAYGSTAPPPGTYPAARPTTGTSTPTVYAQNIPSGAAAATAQPGVGTTDNALANQVRQALNTGNLGSLAQNIQVAARNGTVTLAGTVPSEQQRQMVDTLVRNTSGVVSVNDQMQVGPPGTLTPTEPLSAPAYESSAGNRSQAESALINEVQQVLNNSPSLAAAAAKVQVAAQDGTVTLTGTVPTEQDKQRIESVVRNLHGVANVSDQLQVSAPPTGRSGENSRIYSNSPTGTPGSTSPGTANAAGEIFSLNVQGLNQADRTLAEGILNGLQTDTALASLLPTVNINVADGKVTLRGRVQSQEQKATIESAVKRAAGVNNVIDELQVKNAGSDSNQ